MMFPTNFSQNEQTDFILINKSSMIKPKFSNIVETNISDHYLVLSDFYLLNKNCFNGPNALFCGND